MPDQLSSPSEAKRHAYRSLIAYLGEAGVPARLFELLERHGFLAEQADFFGDFGRTSEDVEAFVLPAAIEAGDWNRFLHYAAIALNLRGLSDDLAEPEILQALTRSGRRNLALDAAGRLAEPLRRATALAFIAHECRDDPGLFRQMLELLGQSLEAPLPLSTEPGEIAKRIELLAGMARLLGPDLSPCWPLWIEKAGLSQEQAAPIWQAVAESWLDRGELEAPALWETVRQITDSRTLLAFLPDALGRRAPEDPEWLFARLLSFFPAEDDRRHAGLVFLSRLARSHPAGSPALWEGWNLRQEIPWTLALIEAGGPLLALQGPEGLESLASSLGDPATRAALRIVVLEAAPDRLDPVRLEAAQDAVEKIPDGPEKLHWALRYLQARSSGPTDEIRSQVAAVARYLHEIRYEAPPEDLRRYLDLIALHFEAELPFQIECVLTSPASHPDILHALVRSAQSSAVLDQVLENAARYASLVVLNEAQAFRLRGDLLIGAARRLCLLGRDPGEVMETAAERLLLQEEDEARSALVPLAIDFPGAAERIARGIQDGKRKLLAQIRARSADRKDLEPSRLYAQVVQTASLETELSGLTALLGPPDDPDLLDRAPEDRVDLCLRLGWHALTFEARHFQEDWDPRAILSRIEPRLALPTDEELVAWTPAIVALAVQPNDRQAVAEVIEAAERIAGLEGVSWPVRREALKSLFASLPTLFEGPAGTDSSRAHRHARAALSTLAHLPFRLSPGKARDELTAHWEEIQVMITAAVDWLGRPIQRKEESQETTVSLRDLIVSSGISPAEPGAEALVRRVWAHSSDLTRQELAENVQDSLASGGRLQAETAVLWWLHAHLPPRLGELDEPGLERAREAASALSQARSLGLDRKEVP